MHIQNNVITPATYQNYTYDILSLTNSTLLTAGNILFPTYDFLFLFHRKMYYPLLLQCPFSHLTSCTPTKSNLYLANSLTAGTGWCTCLRHFAASQMVASSIHDDVIGIFIYIILPAAVWPWGSPQPLTKMSTRISPGR